jgi:hypothetical protein
MVLGMIGRGSRHLERGRTARRGARRLGALVAVAGLWASVGSGVFAAPALAGGVDPGNSGLLSAALYNVTPYTWTLVSATSPPGGPAGNSDNCARLYSPQNGPGCWDTLPQPTIAPGGGSLYRLRPWEDLTGGICGGDDKYGFDAYITYRVNVLGGPPEYATLLIAGEWINNLCLGGKGDPGFGVVFTSAPPPAGYDPWNANGVPPPGQIANPQLTYQHNVPFLYDQSFGITGNYTVDGSSDLGAPFVDLASSLCNGATNTTCSFTQKGPLTWGIGPAVKKTFENCVVGPGGQRVSPTTPGVPGETPPPTDPSWAEVAYSASRTASLSVGAGVTGSVEENLFNIVSAKISVSVEAETEWTDEQTFTRKSKVFMPANNIAGVWVAPVVGRVTGTLVMSFGSSTFTIVNFTEERSGVTKDPMTPAFNVVTKIRPMTDAEFNSDCLGKSSSSGGLLGGGHRLGWPSGKAPMRLTPGQGVAGVKLGETQAQVVRQLGQPRVKTFFVDPCRSLGPGCDAVPGRGGTWSYPQMSVVFGPDWRVSGVSYRGARLSAKGVGVGSSLVAVRAAYPGVSCTGAKQRLCTLPGVYAKHTVRTVFHLSRTRAGRLKCDRVQIYVFVPSAKSVSA